MEKRVSKEPKVSKSNKYFEIYLEYVRMYSVLQLKWTIQRGYSTEIKNIWLDMTRKLNGCGGPVRDVTHWKKVFTEWKSHTRKKLKCNKPLNDLEKQLVELTDLTTNPERQNKLVKVYANKLSSTKESNTIIKKEPVDETVEDTDNSFIEQETTNSSDEAHADSQCKSANETRADKENHVQMTIPSIQPFAVLNNCRQGMQNCQSSDASTQVNQHMLDASNISDIAALGVALRSLVTTINRYCDVIENKS